MSVFCGLKRGEAFVIDYEEYEGRGYELSGSRNLIERVLDERGGKIKIILLDGLYYCGDLIRKCKGKGIDVLKC